MVVEGIAVSEPGLDLARIHQNAVSCESGCLALLVSVLLLNVDTISLPTVAHLHHVSQLLACTFSHILWHVTATLIALLGDWAHSPAQYMPPDSPPLPAVT